MTAPHLPDFFAPPNEISLDSLSGAPGALVARLIARVEGGRRSLLPARVGAVTRWYGVAPPGRQARDLREELRHWLGPPLAMEPAAALTGGDDMDRAAAATFDSWSVVVAEVPAAWQQSAREAVSSLLDVWALTPERSAEPPRPVGRVLRQFYEALLAKSRDEAEAALDELRSRSLVSATNLRFLRVQMLGELGSPAALREYSLQEALTLLARPPAVTERLAEAANALTIEPARVKDPDWESVGVAIDRDWPALATELHQVTNVATARCFALAELALPSPRRALLGEVAQRFPDDPILSVVGARWGTPPQIPAETSALEHYHQGRYETALLAAEGEGVSRHVVSIALAAAANLATGDAASRALALLDGLSSGEQNALAASSVESILISRLRSLTSDSRIPTGWLDWLRGSWADRPDLLVDWCSCWAQAADSLNADLAMELLEALNDERRGRVRNGLPVFIKAVLQTDLSPGRVPLAVTLFDVLLSSEPGRIEHDAALVLLDDILYAGCTAREYSELLEAIEAQLPAIGPRDAAWIIQILDLLLVHGAPDSNRRAGTLATASAAVLAWQDRLEPLDRDLLAQFFPDSGLGRPLDAHPDVTPAEHPPSIIGIYTLLESASRQASEWMRARWPQVEIRTSSDHVNTEALTALARGVDVLLVQTSHAKHAATQALEVAVPDKSRLILVSGRGATSLLRAVVQWSMTPRL